MVITSFHTKFLYHVSAIITVTCTVFNQSGCDYTFFCTGSRCKKCRTVTKCHGGRYLQCGKIFCLHNRHVSKHRDDELKEFFTSILLEVLQDDTVSPTSPPLLAPSSAYLVLAMPTSCSAWRTRTTTITQIEAPTTGCGGLKHGKNSVKLQCHYVRQVLVSQTWFCKISLLS